MTKNQKLADLIQGIEGMLSKSRCPLTGEEEVLLKLCLAELEDLRNNKSDKLGSMEKVARWLLLLFEVYGKFIEFF
ncbi:hypothetical protein KML24007_04160 [Alistipes indistinctus]|uniref:hypothetical protein n=1 Tax=Alistipes indistinctus TaxID=626932 RepID=UPI0036F27605